MSEQRDPAQRYQVGAAAHAAGVHVQTLYYYERRGLVSARARTAAGYREYGPDQVDRIRAIKRAQSLGFTLREIRELIEISSTGRASRRVGDLTERKLEEIDRKIRDLEQMRASLEEARETCSCGGDLSRCDVLEGLTYPPDCQPERGAPRPRRIRK